MILILWLGEVDCVLRSTFNPPFHIRAVDAYSTGTPGLTLVFYGSVIVFFVCIFCFYDGFCLVDACFLGCTVSPGLVASWDNSLESKLGFPALED